MDEDGYPTEETISKIINWDYADFEGLAKFLHELWIYKDYSKICFDNSWDCNNKADKIVWNVSTGGWSGHEEILRSLPALWKMQFHFSWQRGGYYVFKR